MNLLYIFTKQFWKSLLHYVYDINHVFFYFLQLSIPSAYYFLLIFSMRQLAFLYCLYCFIVSLLSYNMSLLIFTYFLQHIQTYLVVFPRFLCWERNSYFFRSQAHRIVSVISFDSWHILANGPFILKAMRNKIKPWHCTLNSSNC